MRIRCIKKKIMSYGVIGLLLFIFSITTGGGMRDEHIKDEHIKKEKTQTGEAKLLAVKTVTKEDGTQETWMRVVRVVDGDTFVVIVNGTEEKIRMIGIDTPEVVDPRKPVQCFGREASNKAKEILTDAYVRLESDPTQSDRDKYGRLLRYVYLENGIFFNPYMIKEGYAHEYTYQIPYTFQKEFKAAERDAREQKKGLWADGICRIDKKM